ncbi:hypothetical protein [Candidatus Mycoplasma haematominutum]|uniref:hypothetical protein n=1 Tax=Candidatus Mycoplasma haematominutum TaxID=209446 RepID=UPI0005C59390|nr:hypothetical protein [Candidatus Mycoplasma haematominutum]
MSFLEWLQAWKVGGVFSGLVLPLLLLHFSKTETPQLVVNGWTLPTLNGLYSRVRLFLKNIKTPQSSSDIVQTSTGGGKSSESQVPDLIVEVPLNYFGIASRYRYCLPNSSNLKAKVEAKQVASTETPTCQLISPSTSTSDLKEEVLNYLLDLTTKYISVQHAANMVMFYDDKVNFSGSSSKLKQLSRDCSISSAQDRDVVREFFLHSIAKAKKCLPSPTAVELNLRLPTSTNSEDIGALTREKLAGGSLSGVLKYGIFDYWTTNLVKSSSNQKGVSVKVNWPIVYSLSDSTLEQCSLNAFHARVMEQQLSISALSSCFTSAR